ncbi:ureidoglycolate lyase [Afifella pfennigii]|uniref:ureidoglycolate lyase n=1 Tax=Afifella pfennigii TaxID=209897 RepID=UPI0004788811|nr:ureidoglycolate lyase [Afifella pfennigii]
MSREIVAEPLARAAFSPYGEVISAEGAPAKIINQGMAARFDALARIDVGQAGGHPIVSLFRGEPFVFPIPIKLMERHPLGSQAFFPLSGRRWLIVVAPDEDGRPGAPRAFLARGNEGVQYRRGTWHHPLMALTQRSDFLVVDRAPPAGEKEGANLEEFVYPEPYLVRAVA